MKRVMTALLEGITLGALEYQPAGAATGYVAFATLALFVLGLVLLGSGGDMSAGALAKAENALTVVEERPMPSTAVWHPTEPDELH
jgi:hypothetical protein